MIDYTYDFKHDLYGNSKLEKLGLKEEIINFIHDLYYERKSDFDSFSAIIKALGGSMKCKSGAHRTIDLQFIHLDLWKPHSHNNHNRFTAHEINHFLIPKMNVTLASIFNQLENQI